MAKQIKVEDYGAELADAIISISAAIKHSPLSARALAVLLHDYDKNLTITDCARVIEILPRLADYYLKAKK